MERKSLTVELNPEQEGAFGATIATFGVTDQDADVTFPGSFPEGKSIPVSAYQHASWKGALPVGLATIGQDSIRAFIKGEFFLDTPDGLATYKTLRRLAPAGLAPWSYGYDVTKAVRAGDPLLKSYPDAVRGLIGLDVHEASPVLVPAGVGTGLDYIKSLVTLPDHAVRALADAKAYVDRELSLADMRTKEGRAISSARRERLAASLAAFHAAAGELEQLLAETEPAPKDEPAKAAALRSMRMRASLGELRLRLAAIPAQ